MTGGGAFSNTDHLQTLGEKQRDWKKDRDVAHEYRIKGLVNDIKSTDKRLLIRAKITGAWMSVHSLQIQVQYYLLQSFGILYVLIITPLP